ncbi:MAG: CPBP family intramembrane metalloprotease [Bacteroidales bacterium]|nr:CPBP family intramembrane metalloprotease [Bacteroidales bacterium]
MRPLRSGKRNFDIFGAHSWYAPGIGGTVMLLVMLLVGVLIGAGVTLVTGKFFSKELCLMIAYPIQFVPPLLYVSLKSRSRAFWDEGVALSSNHFGKWNGALMALLVVLLTLSVAYVTDILNYGLSIFTRKFAWLSAWYDEITALMKSLAGGTLWISAVSVVIMAPLFEEWMFRGMILRGLLRKMHPVWAIVISAFLFSLIHLNPWQGIPAFILGCVFGYVYWKTGNLWLTILMHATNNAIAVVVSSIDSIKDYEFFISFIPSTGYWILFAFASGIIILALTAIKSIPMEGRSNCDKVEPLSVE